MTHVSLVAAGQKGRLHLSRCVMKAVQERTRALFALGESTVTMTRCHMEGCRVELGSQASLTASHLHMRGPAAVRGPCGSTSRAAAAVAARSCNGQGAADCACCDEAMARQGAGVHMHGGSTATLSNSRILGYAVGVQVSCAHAALLNPCFQAFPAFPPALQPTRTY